MKARMSAQEKRMHAGFGFNRLIFYCQFRIVSRWFGQDTVLLKNCKLTHLKHFNHVNDLITYQKNKFGQFIHVSIFREEMIQS